MSVRKLWSENKSIVVASLSILIVSLATILVFTPSIEKEFLQADLLQHPSAGQSHEGTPPSEQNQEEAYGKLLEDQADPYFVLNQDGKITFANDKFAGLIGKTPAETSDMFMFDFIVREHQEKVFKSYREVYADKTTAYKTGPFRISGGTEEKIVFLSLMPVDKERDLVLVEVYDVTHDLQELKKKMETGDSSMDDSTRIVVQRILSTN